MARMVLFAFCLLVFHACTSITLFENPDNDITSKQISFDKFSISSPSLASVDQYTFQNLILRKAAKLTLQAGHTHFAILPSENITSQSSTPTPLISNGAVDGISFDTEEAQSNRQSLTQPGQDTIIRVFSSFFGQSVPPNTFDAQEVYKSISLRTKG